LRHGDLKSALQITQVGLQDAEAIHNSSAMANGLRTLGRIYLRAGQFDAAGSILEKALKIHSETLDPVGAPMSRIALVRLRMEENDFSRALELLTDASEEASRHQLALADGLSRLLRAEAEYFLSKEVRADLIEAAEEIFRSSGYVLELCETALFFAQISIDREDSQLASKKLRQIKPTLESGGSLEQRAHGLYLHALIDALQGRKSDALLKLSSLELLAKNSVLPRVLAWCRQGRQKLGEAVK